MSSSTREQGTRIAMQGLLTSALLLASVLAMVGCSGGKYDATVAGTVTIDGNPVGPGEIIFSPSDPLAQPPTGHLDNNGRYTLTTGGDPSVQSGDYVASIKAYKVQEGAGPGVRLSTPSEPQTPAKYLRAETSGLAYTVSPGSNTIDIAITSEE